MTKIINNPIEFEIAILDGAKNILDSILFSDLFEILDGDDHQIMFHEGLHQNYFFLQFVDFISVFDKSFQQKDCPDILCDALKYISEHPILASTDDAKYLKNAINIFIEWLYTTITIDVYISELEIETQLKINRRTLLYIAGNTNKHRRIKLGVVAKIIMKTLASENVKISLSSALQSIESLHERFHNDILNYLSTYIVEMLLKIRRGIYLYLLTEYNKSYTPTDMFHGIQRYKYKKPNALEDELIFYMYWELMNDIKLSKLEYFKELTTTKYLKMRY